jgi:hypothetical protein
MYCGIIKHRDDLIPMRTDEEGWIPHTTGEIPCDGRKIVDVKFKNGTVNTDLIASCLGWVEGTHPYNIAAWRPHKKPEPEKWAAEKAAFAAGKKIQFSYKEEPWIDLDETVETADPPWWDKNLEWRIKPEPQWIPIGPDDAPPGSVIRGRSEEKTKAWCMILTCSDFGIRIQGRDEVTKWSEAMEWGWQIKRPGEDWKPCKKEVAV